MDKRQKDGRTLTAALHGEIDHHSAKTARTQLDLLIERENPTVLRLQLADVGFCDSSGLGFIMGCLLYTSNRFLLRVQCGFRRYLYGKTV